MYTSNTKYWGSLGGSNNYDKKCPAGHVINRFYGKAGLYVDQICATCTDGTDLGCVGGGGGTPFSVSQDKWSEVPLRSGKFIDKIFTFGSAGGVEDTAKCPANQYMSGFTGYAGKYLDRIGMYCSVHKNDFCINNLDDPYCRDVSTDILNAACAKNMSNTCRDRKNELYETTVGGFCATNKTDQLCSCYENAPAYIPNEIRGLPGCWSQKCATYGYIPVNMRYQCPSIKICRQDLTTSGDSNLLSKNIIIQDCSSTTPPPGSGSGPSAPSNPVPPETKYDVPGMIDANDKDSVSYTTLLYIIIAFAIVIFGGYMLMSDDNDNVQYMQQGPYMQRPY